jgi:antitoxin (DNA-binding transcriptional repressor) of toxin-antitoxin stability system
MTTRIRATDLARNLSDILNRIAYQGERFVVERNGQVIAEIGPAERPGHTTVGELYELLGRLNRPDEDFARDLEDVQANQGKGEYREWPS